MEAPLGMTDSIVFVAAILATALIGLCFTRGNRTLSTYLRADGKLTVLPVALSLMSSSISGLTIIGSSAEIFYQGPGFSMVCFAMLASGPITALTILPIFYQMKELSLHKYLERRFGSRMRYFVSLIYMTQALFHTAVVMYLPCLALETIIGLQKMESILLIGFLCVFYSTLGGIRAVVWTDAFLGLIMLLSLLMVILIGTYEAGGPGKVFRTAADGHRLEFTGFLELSLTARHTLLAIAVGATLKQTYMICVNQVQMQRVLSLGSLRQAQLAFILCSLFVALISILSTFLGLLIYSAYHDCDPFLGGHIGRRDGISLHYLALRMSHIPGLQGLFAAGLISGALSSMSSFSNSMAALIIEDFIVPLSQLLKRKPIADHGSTWLAKLLSAVAGLLCLLVACAVDRSSSRLLQTAHLLGGALGVPVLAAFALGIFTRNANAFGLAVALASAFILGGYLSVYQTFASRPLEPTMPVHHDELCARIFNRSMSLEEAKEIAEHIAPGPWMGPPAAPALKLENVSYMMIPIIMFTLVVIIASIVSVLTGGDNPDDELLIKWLRRAIERRDGKVARKRKVGVSYEVADMPRL